MAIRTWKRFGWANLPMIWNNQGNWWLRAACLSVIPQQVWGRQVQSLLSVPGSDGQRGRLGRQREGRCTRCSVSSISDLCNTGLFTACSKETIKIWWSKWLMTLYGTAGIVIQGLNTVTFQLLSMLCCPVSQSPHEQRVAWVSLGSLTPRKMGLAGGLLSPRGKGKQTPRPGVFTSEWLQQTQGRGPSSAVWEPMCCNSLSGDSDAQVGEFTPSLTSSQNN